MRSDSDTKFDAGPLLILKKELSMEDFKACVVDEKSMQYLVKTIQNKRLGQRFATYMKLKKVQGEAAKLYIFCRPTLPFNASKTELKDAEDFYGCKPIVADPDIPGLLHTNLLASLIEEADKEDDIERRDFLLNPSYDLGGSCLYVGYFDHLNRSSLVKSIQDVNSIAYFAWIVTDRVVKYDEKNNDFMGRESSMANHLWRSFQQEILDSICSHLTKETNRILLPSKLETQLNLPIRHSYSSGQKQDECLSFFYQKKWDKKLRYNKSALSHELSKAAYIIAGLRDCEPGPFWPKESDEEIIEAIFSVASKWNMRLDVDALVGQYGSSKITALMFAARKGSFRIIKALVENGSDLYAKDAQGKSVMDYLADDADSSADLYLRDVFALNDAIKKNDVLALEKFLVSPVINIALPIDKFTTPLEKAIQVGNLPTLDRVVRALLKQGKNIDAPSKCGGMTPLFIAVKQGDKDKIQLLLKAGANPTLVLDHPDFAKDLISADIYKMLIPQKEKTIKECKEVKEDDSLIKEIEKINFGGIFDEKKFDQMLKAFLEKNRHLNQLDSQGNTAICLAAKFGQYEILEKLIQFGANINVSNDAGETPLTWVVANDDIASFKLLVKNGVYLADDVLKLLKNKPLYLNFIKAARGAADDKFVLPKDISNLNQLISQIQMEIKKALGKNMCNQEKICLMSLNQMLEQEKYTPSLKNIKNYIQMAKVELEMLQPQGIKKLFNATPVAVKTITRIVEALNKIPQKLTAPRP